MLKITPLFSGSTGNCTHIKYGADEILIDAGVSCRSLVRALNNEGSDLSAIRAILITHEHVDHVRGLETIIKKHRIPVYINRASAGALKVSPDHPLFSCICVRDAGERIETENFAVEIFRTPHDSIGSVGYKITLPDGGSIGYATDIGHITAGVANALSGCDTVMIESNHDLDMLKSGAYPYFVKQRILSDKGHLSNDACGAFLPCLVRRGTQRIILAHLSKDNNRPDIALRTAICALRREGISPSDASVCVARRA